MSFWQRVMKALEGLAVKRGGACPYTPHMRYDPTAKRSHRPYR